jgi:signal transduction histidine kinase
MVNFDMLHLLNRLAKRLRNNPIGTVSLTILLTFLLFFPLGLNSWNAYQQFNRVIVSDLKLQKLMGTIVYLDEVLTMSAQMNATTGEIHWEQRYKSVEPQLDTAIKEMIQLVPDAQDASVSAITDAANLKLIEMEYQSFEWVRQGKREKAVALLRGPSYLSQKKLYADGTTKTTIAINQRIEQNQAGFSQVLLVSAIVSIGSLGILMPLWLIILRMLNRYLMDLQSARHSLHLLNQDLEARVADRTADLTKTLNDLQQMQLTVVQVEKMSGLGNLVAGVAHEINNPIGFLNGSVNHAQDYVKDLLTHLNLYEQPNVQSEVIRVHAETIELDFVRSDLPKLLSSMSDAVDRIKQISTSLRTFSRTDLEYPTAANLHEGIESTILILKYRLQGNEKRPAIKIELNYGEIPVVSCFPGKLNQVFMNILANAIDIFDEMAQTQSFEMIQSQTITIRTAIVHQHIHISIADNAGGMSEAVKAKIL